MRPIAILLGLFLAASGCLAGVPLLPSGATWRVLATASEPDPAAPGAWREAGFDDSAWTVLGAPVVRGIAGSPDSVPPGPGGILVRGILTLPYPGNYSTVTLRAVASDGVVVWLNGAEVLRDGIPAGVSGPSGAASAARPVPVASTATFRVPDLAALHAGDNQVAVLVLAAAGAASFSFDLSVEGDPDTAAPSLVDIQPVPGSAVAGLPFVEVQFDKPVRGVDAQDLLVNGQPAASVQQFAPGQFVFTLPGITEKVVEIRWADTNGITDLGFPGNAFAGGKWSYLVDELSVPSGVVISEFMASNGRTLRDEDGDYSDWIEIANLGADDVAIGGWSLTDDAALPGKWRFPDLTVPARGFVVVFASSKDRTNDVSRLHANFKLDPGGEYLGLYRADGAKVSDFAPKFPPQKADVSYGRVAGAPEITGYFDKATPGAPNSVTGSGFAPAVAFSRPGGTYTNAITVALSLAKADPDAVIRYTTDRTLPGPASPVYTAPLTFTDVATHLRARAFSTGKLPGPVSSETYIPLGPTALGVTSDLPLLLIHDYNRGRPTTSPGVFATVQVFEPVNGVAALTNAPNFSHRALVASRGSSTEGLAKVSLKVELQDEFGFDDKQEFVGLPAESDWVLYAPNVFDPIMTHNPLIHRLAREMGWYSSRTRFVELYLVSGTGPTATTSYNGIYVLEEKIKQGKHRVDVDKLQPEDATEPAVSGGYLFKVDRPDPGDLGFPAAGTTMLYVDPKEPMIKRPERKAQRTYVQNFFAAFSTALNGANFTDPTNGYRKYFETRESIDFHILETFSFNVDSLVLSTYLYKPRGGKLAFGPHWDFDRALGSTDGRDSNPKTWGANFFTAYWWPRFFRDPDFLQAWIDRYQQLRDTTLSQQHLFAVVDELTGQLIQSQPREKKKWGTAYRGLTYANEILYSKNWMSNRVLYMDAQFATRPVAGPPRQNPRIGQVELSLVGMAKAPNAVLYYTTDGTDPRLPGGKVSPSAQVYPLGSSVLLDRNTKVIARTYNPDQRSGGGPPPSPWSGPFTGSYVVAPQPLQITEVHYHPAATPGSGFGADDFEFVEVRNAGPVMLALDGFRLAGGVTFAFGGTNELRMLPPLGRCVVVANRAAFASRYPAVGAIAGEYQGHLSNGGETVTLVGPVDEVVASVSYDTAAEPLADGAGWSLVPRDEAPQPIVPSAAGWKVSAVPGGSPGDVDPVSLPSPDADRDGDGLPDAWEAAHGLRTDRSTGDDGASGDPDHDGMSNLAEFLAGTDPRSASSRVSFRGVPVGGGAVELRFDRVPGRSCRVVAVDRLGGAVVDAVEFPAQATPGEARLAVDPSAGARFYRLEFR